METHDDCPTRVAVSSATFDSISSYGRQQIEKLNGLKTKLNAFDKKVETQSDFALNAHLCKFINEKKMPKNGRNM